MQLAETHRLMIHRKLFLLLLAFPFRFAILKTTAKTEITVEPNQISVLGSRRAWQSVHLQIRAVFC